MGIAAADTDQHHEPDGPSERDTRSITMGMRGSAQQHTRRENSKTVDGIHFEWRKE